MLRKGGVKWSREGLLVSREDGLPERRSPLRGKPWARYMLPYRGLLGLLLIAIAWPLSWAQGDAALQYTFFPLWLGFILAIDGLVLRRTGTSLIVRSPKIMAAMFVVAIPFWWTFEAINSITQNWVYIGSDKNTSLFDYLESSLAFSVVIPAVFEVSELIGSFGLIKRFARLPALILIWRLLMLLVLVRVCYLASVAVRDAPGRRSYEQRDRGPPLDGV